MREILFRGKLPDSNEFVYGDLRQYGWRTFIVRETPDGKYEEIEVDSDFVHQFSGMEDCKGNKIFENDMLEWPVCCGKCLTLGVVRFEDGAFVVIEGYNEEKRYHLKERLERYGRDICVSDVAKDCDY